MVERLPLRGLALGSIPGRGTTPHLTLGVATCSHQGKVKKMDDQYFVEIVSKKTGKVASNYGPFPLSRAQKIESGININLDHDSYFLRVSQEPSDAPASA